ncbi:hypothetical protein [Halosegnis longus]|uniref:hypothetical protein n=1 Tax=Halosegnis longus TaxID=2216012 RepID=UPI00129E4293|nr:hypothetical protein [Halosegnis longus]
MIELTTPEGTLSLLRDDFNKESFASDAKSAANAPTTLGPFDLLTATTSSLIQTGVQTGDLHGAKLGISTIQDLIEELIQDETQAIGGTLEAENDIEQILCQQFPSYHEILAETQYRDNWNLLPKTFQQIAETSVDAEYRPGIEYSLEGLADLIGQPPTERNRQAMYKPTSHAYDQIFENAVDNQEHEFITDSLQTHAEKVVPTIKDSKGSNDLRIYVWEILAVDLLKLNEHTYQILASGGRSNDVWPPGRKDLNMAQEEDEGSKETPTGVEELWVIYANVAAVSSAAYRRVKEGTLDRRASNHVGDAIKQYAEFADAEQLDVLCDQYVATLYYLDYIDTEIFPTEERCFAQDIRQLRKPLRSRARRNILDDGSAIDPTEYIDATPDRTLNGSPTRPTGPTNPIVSEDNRTQTFESFLEDWSDTT